MIKPRSIIHFLCNLIFFMFVLKGAYPLDDANAIKAHVNEPFDIILESNKTTGFSWELIIDRGESFYEIVNTTYVLPTENRMGASGKELWTLKPVKAGTFRVTFIYRRPWEKNKPPLEKKSFTIIAE
ncbi:protease inhibitor I42 family protein [Chlamydiota bacterium]